MQPGYPNATGYLPRPGETLERPLESPGTPPMQMRPRGTVLPVLANARHTVSLSMLPVLANARHTVSLSIFGELRAPPGP